MSSMFEFLSRRRFEYPLATSFEQVYRCYPISFIRPELENGDKIILPPSALQRLASMQIDYPMLFQLHNPHANRTTHCGVLEFVAEEGFVFIPYWMMKHMLLREGDMVRIRSATSMPKATYVKLQPHTIDFLDNISNPKSVLETTLRKFSCLTEGDTIMIAYNNKEYYIDIKETKPVSAVTIIETDCEVDFAPPLDYKEPEPTPSPPATAAAISSDKLTSTAAPRQESASKEPAEAPKPTVFAGVGRRIDGKPAISSIASGNVSSVGSTSQVLNGQLKTLAASATTAAAAAKSSSNANRGRKVAGKLVFGGSRNGHVDDVPDVAASKPSRVHEGQPAAKEMNQTGFQAFTGKKYSLID